MCTFRFRFVWGCAVIWCIMVKAASAQVDTAFQAIAFTEATIDIPLPRNSVGQSVDLFSGARPLYVESSSESSSKLLQAFAKYTETPLGGDFGVGAVAGLDEGDDSQLHALAGSEGNFAYGLRADPTRTGSIRVRSYIPIEGAVAHAVQPGAQDGAFTSSVYWEYSASLEQRGSVIDSFVVSGTIEFSSNDMLRPAYTTAGDFASSLTFTEGNLGAIPAWEVEGDYFIDSQLFSDAGSPAILDVDYRIVTELHVDGQLGVGVGISNFYNTGSFGLEVVDEFGQPVPGARFRPIPEPCSLAMVFGLLGVLGGFRRRQRNLGSQGFRISASDR